MKIIIGLFHFIMFISGATLRLDAIKYPNLLMLINRLITTILIIYLLKQTI
jgi:hypothetical protein